MTKFLLQVFPQDHKLSYMYSYFFCWESFYFPAYILS